MQLAPTNDYEDKAELAQLMEDFLFNFSMDALSDLEECLPLDESPDYKTFTFVVTGWLSTLFVVLGIITNVYSVTLLAKMKTGQSLRVYLRALAVWDISLLVSSFFMYSFRRIVIGVTQAHYWAVAEATSYANGFAMTSMAGSAWTLVLITLARFYAVQRPIHLADSVFERWPIHLVLAIAVAAAVFNAPCHLELTVTDCYDTDMLLLHNQILPTDMRQTQAYLFYYKLIATGLLVQIGPFILIAVLSVLTMITMHHTAKDQGMT